MRPDRGRPLFLAVGEVGITTGFGSEVPSSILGPPVIWRSSIVEQSAHDRQVAGAIPAARIDGRCSLIVKPLTVDQEDAGANPVIYPYYIEVAQLVERLTVNQLVGGSSPPLDVTVSSSDG